MIWIAKSEYIISEGDSEIVKSVHLTMVCVHQNMLDLPLYRYTSDKGKVTTMLWPRPLDSPPSYTPTFDGGI